MTAQPVGATGGYTSLYLINESNNSYKYINKGFDKVGFTYYSLFSGIGGMTMGLEPLGGKCLGAWEFDPYSKRQYAQEAHKLLHPHIPIHSDVTKINPHELEDFDLLAFTPPCQAFSVAGKRGGFEDTRGTLTFDALNIAKVKKPKVLFMENVKGLLSHDKGNTIGVICHAINEIGYLVDFTILNSKYFDVAQNRERLYLIAVREDLAEEEEWDIKGANVLSKVKSKLKREGLRTYKFDFPKQTEVKTKIRDFLEIEVEDKYHLHTDKTEKLVMELTKRGLKETDRVAVEGSYQPDHSNSIGQRYQVWGANDVAGTITATTYKQPQAIAIESSPVMLGHIELKGHDAIKRVYSINGQSPTLTTMGGGHREPKIAELKNNGYIIRKLTPCECLRLQATPTHYIKLLLENFSNSRCYKFSGNGLTITVIQALGKKIIKYL